MRLMLNPLTVIGIALEDDGRSGAESVATVSLQGCLAASNWTMAGLGPRENRLTNYRERGFATRADGLKSLARLHTTGGWPR
ncbi:MAG: hypothetical protein ABFD89_09200 [Bryobacteraceae bacterium]